MAMTTAKNRILRVHKKLREAESFLGKMTKQEGPRGDSDRFDYYLSAFFSATMSVRHNAIKEWGTQWKANLSDEDKENKLFNLMGKGRNAEVHHTGTPRSVKQEEVDRTRDMIGIGGRFSFGRDEFVHGFMSTYWFQIDGTDVKVTKVCGDYLALLQRMVADFSKAPTGECPTVLHS